MQEHYFANSIRVVQQGESPPASDCALWWAPLMWYWKVKGVCEQAPPSCQEVAASGRSTMWWRSCIRHVWDGCRAASIEAGHTIRPRARNIFSTTNVLESLMKSRADAKALEEKVFRKAIEEFVNLYWIVSQRDPSKVERAKDNPRRKWPLILDLVPWLIPKMGKCRTPMRVLDFKIWCGTATWRIQWLGERHFLEHYGIEKWRMLPTNKWKALTYLYRIKSKMQVLSFSKELKSRLAWGTGTVENGSVGRV